MVRSYRTLLWGLALVGALLDQGSKYWVFDWLYNNGQGASFEIVPGVFQLFTQFTGQTGPDGGFLPKVNYGALFGLAGEYRHLANGIFAVVSVAAAVAIIGWSLRAGAVRDWSLCTALGLILAGTLGNLYDRLVFGGVRDFLYFYWIEWPVFNVADCCLVCGAFLLLTQAFWGTHPEPVAEPVAEVVRAPEVAEVKS